MHERKKPHFNPFRQHFLSPTSESIFLLLDVLGRTEAWTGTVAASATTFCLDNFIQRQLVHFNFKSFNLTWLTDSF
jgi:hypothetical protein